MSTTTVWRGSRRSLAVVLAIQVVALLWFAYPRAAALIGGDVYRLRVTAVDRVDPARGAFVDLDYPGLPTDTVTRKARFVPLLPEGGLRVGARATSDRPSGPYIACHVMTFDDSATCGIETWFVSQEQAPRLEDALRSGGAVAKIKVDGRGHAAIVGVERARPGERPSGATSGSGTSAPDGETGPAGDHRRAGLATP